MDIEARTLIATALGLRASHPQAPALAVLDLAMAERRVDDIDFATADPDQAFVDHRMPPSRFAGLLREAFAPDIDLHDFRSCGCSAEDIGGLTFQAVWQQRVLLPFAARYDSTRADARRPPLAGDLPAPAHAPNAALLVTR